MYTTVIFFVWWQEEKGLCYSRSSKYIFFLIFNNCIIYKTFQCTYLCALPHLYILRPRVILGPSNTFCYNKIKIYMNYDNYINLFMKFKIFSYYAICDNMYSQHKGYLERTVKKVKIWLWGEGGGGIIGRYSGVVSLDSWWGLA